MAAGAHARRRRNGKAPPIPDEIPEGQRNTTLASLAGSMRRRRASEATIVAALRAENEERCCPPLDDAEVLQIANRSEVPAAVP